MTNMLRRFYLRQTRQRFLIFSVAAFGIPFSVCLLWLFQGWGGLLFYTFVVALGLFAALLWGYIVWELFAKHVVARLSSRAAETSEGR